MRNCIVVTFNKYAPTKTNPWNALIKYTYNFSPKKTPTISEQF